MQNTRDSSLLRSLAVAFGDGLAFGVGMKLSHRAAGASGPAAARGDLASLIERVAEIEKRVAESGRGAARAIAAGAAQFDQKVLEAVVAALDARLNEQAGHTESRITQLEARLAIELKSLYQQGDSAGSAAEKRIDELSAHLEGQIEALRRQAGEDRQAQSAEPLLRELEDRLAGELQSLHRQGDSVEAAADKRINELSAHFQGQIEALRRQADEDRQAQSNERLLHELEDRLASELQSLHRQGDSVEAAADKRINELSAHFQGQIEALRRQADEDRQAQSAEFLLRELDRLNVELQSLHRQDQSVEALVEKRIDELSANVDMQFALRQQADDDRQAQSAERLLRVLEDRLAGELQSLHQQAGSVEALVEKRVDELGANFDIQIAAIRRQADEDRRSIRSEMIAIHREFAEEAARAVERRIDEVVGRHAAALRAELEHRDDEIAELREVIFGFAQACRALTERPAPRGRQELEPEPSNVQMLPDRRAV